MNLPEIEGYQFEELIGEGGCGFAYRCSHTTGEERVVKVLKALAINPALVRENLDRLARVPAHPGLVGLYGYNLVDNPYYQIVSLHGSKDPETGKWESDDLGALIGRVDEEQASGLVDQLVEALAYEHRHGVMHIGLKPSNIFVSGGASSGYQVRVSDWGQGYVAGLHYLEMGDLGFYASPEQLETGDFSNGRGQQWDVYSFGVVAFQLITGHLPRLDSLFQEFLKEDESRPGSQMSSFATILQQPGQYVEWIEKQPDIIWPNDALTEALQERREIIERCLSLDPAERYTDMRDVLTEFQALENAAAVRQMQGSYVVAEGAMKMRLNKIRMVALGALGLAMVGLVGSVVFFGKFNSAKRKWQQTLSQTDQSVMVTQNRIEEVKSELGAALKDKESEVASAEDKARRIQQNAREVEEFLLSMQPYGNHFFEMILEHRDTDVPGFQLERSLRLVDAKMYYEQLVKRYGEDPRLTEPTADAYRFLGEIYLERGESSEAKAAFAEAEKLLRTLLKQEPGKAQTTKNLARVRKRQSEALFDSGGGLEQALSILKESSSLWREWLVKVPEKELDGNLSIIENLLLEAQWHRLNRQNKLAGEGFEAAVDALVNLQEKNPQDPRVLASLAMAFMGIGEILLESDKQEPALEMYNKSTELLSEAIFLNGAVDEYQYSLASSLVTLGELKREAESLQDAMKLLKRLMPAHADDPRYAITLAECLGALAELQRDAGESVAGIKTEKEAVKLLETVVSKSGETAQAGAGVRFSLAKRSCHLAELYGDVGQFAESKPALVRATQLIDKLLEEDAGNTAYQRLYAYAGGLSAFAREKTGDKKGAIELYAAALAQWQKVFAAHPDDVQAKEGVSWTKRQMEGLK